MQLSLYRAMESDNKKRAELNAPIAKYDVARKKHIWNILMGE